jgi:hypothetical protein
MAVKVSVEYCPLPLYLKYCYQLKLAPLVYHIWIILHLILLSSTDKAEEHAVPHSSGKLPGLVT